MTDTDISQSYINARPQAVQWHARARNALGGTVGHDVRHFEPVPMYIERGEAGRKWDVDGNEYIDFLLGNGAMLLGHSNVEVLEAVRQAVGHGTHFGNDHPLQIEWGEQITTLVPSADKVRFVNSGTEASLLALRLGRAFTGKSKILRFEGHFHGWHDGVVHGFQPPFDADGSLGVPPQVWDGIVTSPVDLDRVDEILTADADIGTAIVEPSGASWGRIPLEPDFLRGLRHLTEQRGVVLVFDEVVTGFRFSPGGAQQLYNITPDLSCFAKIVAGGMPGAAVTGRDDIMALFDFTGDPEHDRHGRVTHYGTYNAAPPAAAAGLAALRQIATGAPTAKADELAVRLRSAFDDVLERQQIAGYVYGESSTFHVFFETDETALAGASSRADLRTSNPDKLKGMPGELISTYQRHLRQHGVDNMSSTGGVLSSAHTDEDIDEATDAFAQTVVALAERKLVLRM